MSSQSFRAGFYSCVLTCLAVIGFFSTGKVAAQDSPRLLTLEEAIQIAVVNNRPLKIATLEVDKSRWQIAETKTKRLPSFNGTVLVSELLNEVSFSFPEHSGIFPGSAPFPPLTAKLQLLVSLPPTF